MSSSSSSVERRRGTEKRGSRENSVCIRQGHGGGSVLIHKNNKRTFGTPSLSLLPHIVPRPGVPTEPALLYKVYSMGEAEEEERSLPASFLDREDERSPDHIVGNRYGMRLVGSLFPSLTAAGPRLGPRRRGNAWIWQQQHDHHQEEGFATITTSLTAPSCTQRELETCRPNECPPQRAWLYKREKEEGRGNE